MSDPIVYTVKVDSSGNKIWYFNDQLHRVDGPAVEYSNGYKAWWLNGQLHRVDGPAIEYSDGSKVWYFNNQLHRVDGPAIENSDGDKAWWLNGKEYTEQEYNIEINKDKISYLELTVADIEKLLGKRVKIIK